MFGEDKATITSADNRTSGPVLRSGSSRLVIHEAWAWLTGNQLVIASEAAALRGEHAAAAALRRQVAAPGTAEPPYDDAPTLLILRHNELEILPGQLNRRSLKPWEEPRTASR